jgi:TPR repeat protein
MSTSNGKDTARDATDGIPNVSEPTTEDNDDGEQKTMSTTKDRAQNDLDLECCICLENLPKDPTKFVRWTCCGQGLHNHCSTDLMSMEVGRNCSLCRAKTPTSEEEHVKQLRPWVKKKKAWALSLMGQKYKDGTSVKQSYEMARRLWEQAAQQGDATAMFSLGNMYRNGIGVEQSHEKAFEYYEKAAQLGFAKAQYSLGCMYAKGKGIEQNMATAMKWAKKAAAQGDEEAIAQLQRLKN